MIEISHRQAQRLIRQRIDGPIPDEQWAVLQAHLEGCEECRAYQAGLAGSERSLRRVLRLRWSPMHGPNWPLETLVKTRRASRAQMRKVIGYASIAAVVILMGVLYSSYRRATAPPPTPTPNLAAIRLTPSPTPARSTFRGVAAYESDNLGSPDIFLLNPGVGGEDNELVNMTDHPAADTQPSWSPDGEWLAFLSDRGGESGDQPGKNEVYVMHVAGSRLTRLTDDPNIQWQGPLSWSADGEWIALTGTPVDVESGEDTASASWVYLVPASGAELSAGPRKLGLTRGAPGGVRFSPADPLLAYASSDPASNIMSYDLEEGQFLAISVQDNATGMRTGDGGAFDWSDDGRLAYIARGPIDPDTGQMTAEAAVQVRTTLSPAQFGAGVFDSRSNQTIESMRGPELIRQAAYVPGREGREQTVVYLLDDDSDGCWAPTLRMALERDSAPRSIRGLCADGTISRQSFTPDGRWLVVLGHLPGGTETALYAARIPTDLTSTEEDAVERLADVEFSSADGLPSQPAIRPNGRLLGITPRSVASTPENAAPADALGSAPGQVVYSRVQGAERSPLTSIRPDGSGARRLPGDAGENEQVYSCAEISPDGEQIAFLSDRESGSAGVNDVFVMDTAGRNVRRLARNIFARGAAAGSGGPAFDCPVWSPDGSRMIAVLRGQDGYRLAVIPTGEDAAVTYLPVSQTSYLVRPIWSPDGTHVLLAHNRDGQTPPRIAAVDLGDVEADSANPSVRILVESDGWGDVYGVAYSPNNSLIAYVVAYYRANQPTSFQLRLMDSAGNNRRNLGALPESRLNGWLGSSPLVWGEDNQLSFMTRGTMHDKVKSHFYMVDLNQLDAVGVYSIAELDEVVFDTAWSPDRRWVMFATEGGLIAVDVEAARQGQSVPVKVNNERVYEVDWR